MAKNERNFIPKDGGPFAIQYNGTNTTAAAPAAFAAGGAEGSKIYGSKLYLDNPTGFNRFFDIYFSSDGITFKKLVRFTIAGGANATKKLFIDFWDWSYLTDAEGNKYINAKKDVGFYIDIEDNACTADIETYSEVY